MKVVILAGGLGTRLSEETVFRPKPLVEIGKKPILWHIMKIYGAYGFTDFVICCGYQGGMIKQYFANYVLYQSDVTYDLKRGAVELHRRGGEPWRVTLVDTGDETMTGGRIRRVRDHTDEETFLLTYGDGVANIDITELLAFHRQQETYATVTAVHPPARYGSLVLEPGQTRISAFHERTGTDAQRAWINGGFFVLEPAVYDYLDSDSTIWEREPLERLARDGMLSAFRHEGFWQPMDTLWDKKLLEELWRGGSAPWKCW
ncbi:MAG: glucose-1-phosphate cytidylyltransferase [Pseudonocardiales bacterium]|nr:glucose-1-phosphate cytidylyltransferase [Pseudonocardiales bacterium]